MTNVHTEFLRVIQFAIAQGIEASEFLDAWMHGDTEDWPEFTTHPQATEPHAQASEIARLMARAKMDSSLHEMSLATIQTLQDVSAEYNAWIRFHSAGGDYDDFLKQYGAFNE